MLKTQRNKSNAVVSMPVGLVRKSFGDIKKAALRCINFGIFGNKTALTLYHVCKVVVRCAAAVIRVMITAEIDNSEYIVFLIITVFRKNHRLFV